MDYFEFSAAEYCRAAFRKSLTNWTVKTEIQVFMNNINLFM